MASVDVQRSHKPSRRLALVRPHAGRHDTWNGHGPAVLHGVGARSSFLRLGPLIAELALGGRFRQHVVDLSPPDSRPPDRVLDEIGFPRPQQALAVGGGGHGVRIGHVLAAFEQVLLELDPALVVLAGDSDATLASALAAAKHGVPVAHLEAGLRTGDWTSGEELNRVLTDRLSDLLFTNCPASHEHLRGEGISDGRVYYVGSTVADWVRLWQRVARQRAARRRFGLGKYQYVLVALQRRATIDGAGRAGRVVDALARLAARAPVVLTLPPRTAAPLTLAGLEPDRSPSALHCVAPLGFLDLLSLAGDAGAIVTDSGSVQEEASALGVTCYTLGVGTERRVTLTHGTNVLLGDDPAALADVEPSARAPEPRPIPGWDGYASKRVADVLTANFAFPGRQLER